MARSIGQIRHAQLITTYGPGAIVPLEDSSYMLCGLDQWTWDGPPIMIQEPRLEARLKITRFQSPPTEGRTRNGVPVTRFPKWAHCPECGRIDQHSRIAARGKNQCQRCTAQLTPSRFVMCCEDGHIDDFPYFNWVHAGSPRTEGNHNMTLETGGSTSSLASIVVTCECGKQQTMDGVFDRTALSGISKCTAQRPWLTSNAAECDKIPRVLQRGASNVWFSATQSAISIPPWTDGGFRAVQQYWPVLRSLADLNVLRDVITDLVSSGRLDFDVDELVDVVRELRGDAFEDQSRASSRNLRGDEYQALLRGSSEVSKAQQFVCTPAGSLPEALHGAISKTMLVERLREVRALESFSRVVPPSGDPKAAKPALSEQRLDWLPAVEVNGEGVFFVVDSDALSGWEGRPEVVQRVAKLHDNYVKKYERIGSPPDRVITPRLVMIHSLAHMLISQWSLDSGYPASSLRERLYVGPDMHGFLIYTATGDSAGSLGGVVAQAERERLGRSFAAAIERAGWCSSDPLCAETDQSGVDGLNLAACHACMLLPEVSCEEQNLLLDRALLIGTPETSSVGFLSHLLASPTERSR